MCQVNDRPTKTSDISDAQNIANDFSSSFNGSLNSSTDTHAGIATETLKQGTLLSCISLFLLITGASLTFPHMQSRRDELGCDALCYGSMTSVRGALGLIGTALMGKLSDKNGSFLAMSLGRIGLSKPPSGRRACLYIGTISSLIGLGIAVSVDSLTGLWLSMIPGALMQHNFDVFKAFVSEYHNDLENMESQTSTSRSGSVGKLGMSAGISFMVGPMLAAFFSPSFQSATYLAMILTMASGIVIYRVPLPVSTVNNDSKQDASSATEGMSKESVQSEFTLLNMVRLQTPTSRAAAALLVIRLNMALAFHIFNTIWPSSLRSRFQFGPSDHARFMSFVGLTYAFSQGFLAKKAVWLCGPAGKVYGIIVCCAVLDAGRYVAYYTANITVVYVSFFFIINALGILNTVITADTGSIAPSNSLGGLFGIMQSAESAAGMLGPFLGGAVSHYFGDNNNINAPLMAVVGIYTFLIFFVLWEYDRLILFCVRESHGQTTDLDSKKSM